MLHARTHSITYRINKHLPNLAGMESTTSESPDRLMDAPDSELIGPTALDRRERSTTEENGVDVRDR
jgi:hypothetical protein